MLSIKTSDESENIRLQTERCRLGAGIAKHSWCRLSVEIVKQVGFKAEPTKVMSLNAPTG